MLKKLIEKHKQKQTEKILNKPAFRLCDLYVGEIVFYKKCEKVGTEKYDHHYREVKKFAFLYEIGYGKYRHIVSSQDLCELGGYNSIIGDYAVHKVRKFEEAFPLYMRKNNLKPNSKVSLKFIYENEKSINEELAPNQKLNDLFQ